MSALSVDVAGILTRAIVDHRLVPGCKLGERQLASIFGVSRIVVQQALIRLAEDGLVTPERNRGAFVARPTAVEAIEVFEALSLIERGVASGLRERLGQSGWERLRAHVGRQRAAIEADDHDLADRLGTEFHELLVRLGANPVVQGIHARLSRRAALLRARAPADFDYCLLIDDHLRIVSLLESGKAAQAMRLIEAHNLRVARSYGFDPGIHPALTPEAALAPYLAPARSDAPEICGECGDAAADPLLQILDPSSQGA